MTDTERTVKDAQIARAREVYIWSLEKHGLRMAGMAILAYLKIKLVEEWKAGEGTTFKAMPRREETHDAG